MGINQLRRREGGRRSAILNPRPGIPGDGGDDQTRGGQGQRAPGGTPQRDRRSRRRAKIGANFLAKRERSVFVKTAALQRRAPGFFRSPPGTTLTAKLETALR